MTTSHSAKKKPVLVIIYNHHYPDNIPKVEKIYEGRFSRIYHLMPFMGIPPPKDNIIPVFGRASFFHSFLVQGFKDYHHSDASHYIFCADDLLLNPVINENNYRDFFKVGEGEAFCPHLDDLDNVHSMLPWRSDNFITYRFNQAGRSTFRAVLKNCLITLSKRSVFWHNFASAATFRLPLYDLEGIVHTILSREDAIKKFKEFGLRTDHFSLYNLKPLIYSAAAHRKILVERPSLIKLYIIPAITKYLISGKDSYRMFKLDYPLAKGFSDLVIVPQTTVDDFIRYCSVFSCGDLFVETAIPTSMVLSQSKIWSKSDLEYKTHDHDLWSGHPPIRKQDYPTISSLMDNWPREYAYIHPIKLSALNFDDREGKTK